MAHLRAYSVSVDYTTMRCHLIYVYLLHRTIALDCEVTKEGGMKESVFGVNVENCVAD